MNRIKRKPTHPGKIIQEDYLKPLSITVTEMASTLGVSRKTLSKIINERGAINARLVIGLKAEMEWESYYFRKNADISNSPK